MKQLPPEDELIELLGSFAYDPLGFVRWAFPWGEPGELQRFREPYPWQCSYLEEVGDLLRQGKPALMATSSGHGVGKSALNGMETWWAFSTFPGTRGVITANTENQLRTKTWVEMAKWHRLFIAKDLFKYSATALFSVDEEMAKEWRIDLVPWSEKNTEAFAGLHNAQKRIVLLFDEASAIPDIIWETAEGALTDEDTEILWSVKGNPTRDTGRFKACFPGGQFAHRWQTRSIDSRTVPGTNKKQLNEWIEDYGEDSDFCRIRIFGEFPRQSVRSFISEADVREAQLRVPSRDNPFSVILGVDVARFGQDASVIYARQGVDARSREPEVYYGLNTMQLVDRILVAVGRYSPSAIFVDEGGVGAGVVDRLMQLRQTVYGIDFGSGAINSNVHDPNTKYANRRAEMWGAMRYALKSLAIPTDVRGATTSLREELCAPSYDFNKKEQIVLESKADMERRGVPSPNIADALALTFAMPFLDQPEALLVPRAPRTEWNPYSLESINEL